MTFAFFIWTIICFLFIVIVISGIHSDINRMRVERFKHNRIDRSSTIVTNEISPDFKGD